VKDRLGCLARADLDIRDHSWFKDMDWGQLYRKEIMAPWLPKITSPLDGENFAEWEEEDKRSLKPLSDVEQKQFAKFC
jgi:protein kinase A